jgi:hypothetical protein
MSEIVTCPNCGTEDLQTVGYVDQWVRGELIATAEGVEFEPGGYTDYGDDYHDTHIECAQCQTVLCELAADPYTAKTSDSAIGRKDAAQVVEALRAFLYGDSDDEDEGDEDVRVNGLDESNTARFLSRYPE